MSNILNNYSLKNHNTFGVDAKAKYFASFSSEDELAELLNDDISSFSNSANSSSELKLAKYFAFASTPKVL